MAKNGMRRALRALFDTLPTPAEQARLWAYFDSSCAYCGQTLVLSERLGHIDHLVAHSMGGTNNIHNHVLACSRCNGDEKREEDWEVFLERKVAALDVRAARHARIKTWMEQTPPASLPDQEMREAAEAIIARAVLDFEAAVEQMRALRQKADLERSSNDALKR